MMVTTATIGSRIRRARELKGWRIRHLAAAMDTTEGYLSNVERGKVIPRSDTLGRLARVLDCSPNDLMGFDHEGREEGEAS